jgi:LacI family transcriptional regulator
MADKATIRDVAARAGVSVTTVSHVLNRTANTRISDETRQRVREAATDLGYAPSRLARGLRLQRSQTLGLLSDEIATTPYAGRIILGAQEAASAHGWVLMLLITGNDPEVERREIQALLQHQVDGVLYATMYHRRVQVPAQLSGLPVVLLDACCDDPSIPAVVPDEAEGGYCATRELIAYGHRDIGFLTNRDDIPATHGRLAGYRNALNEAGLPYRPEYIIVEASDTAGGHRAALRLLRRSDRPTAVFCFNDRMAMGAYRAAAELGLAIPHDLSVISYDNQELIAEGLHPGLTTMALPHYEMGAWALNTMVELLGKPRRGGPPAATWPVLMRCPIVRRQSVAAPPTR